MFFDFDDRRGDLLAVDVDVQVDIRIHTQTPLLHLAIGDIEVGHSQLEFSQVCLGFGR